MARRSPIRPIPGQRALDDLGTPLHEVTFCVIDLETTGGRAADGGITEVGAVRLRGGEEQGRFQTLVNPGVAIPASITVLTGITEAMVHPAPRVGPVLSALLEFLGDAVIVGHNVSYDIGFLDAALVAHGHPRLSNRVVDTCALARRLVRDEVPDCRLGTLARCFRLPHRPTHRALDDALATGHLLHHLLERAGRLGVLGLDDLLALPRLAGHPQVSKLKLTEHLPRSPGVYRFRDRRGEVLYVGKATDLRSRVRSYFSSDQRKKVGQLLRETEAIDTTTCTSTLEASVIELRLIRNLDPRFNRQGRARGKPCWIRITDEAFPRLSVVRAMKGSPSDHLGPFANQRSANQVVSALWTATTIRRCSGRPGAREAPCAGAQMGRALCPCAGDLATEAYAPVVDRLRRGWDDRPDMLVGPLTERMVTLASVERFEEAAEVRDEASALIAVLRRRQRIAALAASGECHLDLPGGGGATLDRGLLVTAWGRDGQARSTETERSAAVPDPASDPAGADAERLCIAMWLHRSTRTVVPEPLGTALGRTLPPLDDIVRLGVEVPPQSRARQPASAHR